MGTFGAAREARAQAAVVAVDADTAGADVASPTDEDEDTHGSRDETCRVQVVPTVEIETDAGRAHPRDRGRPSKDHAALMLSTRVDVERRSQTRRGLSMSDGVRSGWVTPLYALGAIGAVVCGYELSSDGPVEAGLHAYERTSGRSLWHDGAGLGHLHVGLAPGGAIGSFSMEFYDALPGYLAPARTSSSAGRSGSASLHSSASSA